MSEEIPSAADLIRENAALRAEIQHRAAIDAEDTHRLQSYTDSLFRENAALRARIESCLHTGDMEHARVVALLGAARLAANLLFNLDQRGGLGADVHRTITETHQALDSAVRAVRPQADALLARLQLAEVGLAAEQELRARSELIVLAARRLVAGPDSQAYTTLAAAIDAYDEKLKASE